MSECRAPDKKLAPSQIQGVKDLADRLSGEPTADAAAYLTGSPAVFDLHPLDGGGWDCVRSFLSSLSEAAQRDIQKFEDSLRAADTNGDQYLNNAEVLDFVSSHRDRWPSVARFRAEATAYLDRLPAYLSQGAQERLTRSDLSQLKRLKGHYVVGGSVDEYDGMVARLESGKGTLRDRTMAARILQIPIEADGVTRPRGTAPLTYQDLGILERLLRWAGGKGAEFAGMTFASETSHDPLFVTRNAAEDRCVQGITESVQDVSLLGPAVQECNELMEPALSESPETISVEWLLKRARAGELTGSETAALREFIGNNFFKSSIYDVYDNVCPEAGWAQGACEFGVGMEMGIAEEPAKTAARAGALIAFERFVYRPFLRPLIMNAVFSFFLQRYCGGSVADPRQAFGDFQNFIMSQVKAAPVWKKAVRFLGQNVASEMIFFMLVLGPAKDGLVHKALEALGLDEVFDPFYAELLTDPVLIPLLDKYGRLGDPSVRQFFDTNPGVCRPPQSPERDKVRVPLPVPEPVPVVEALPKLAPEAAPELIRAPQISREQVLDTAAKLGFWGTVAAVGVSLARSAAMVFPATRAAAMVLMMPDQGLYSIQGGSPEMI